MDQVKRGNRLVTSGWPACARTKLLAVAKVSGTHRTRGADHLAESVEGRVYRLSPPQRSHGVVAPYTTGEILFGNGMTRLAVTGRYQDGARIVTYGADGAVPAGQELLFRVRTDGQLAAVTQTSTPALQAGDPSCPWGLRSRSSLRTPVIVVCLGWSDSDLSCTPGQPA